MAVEPKIAIARILADLNLVVRYGIAIRIYVSRKLWRIFLIGGCNIDRQTAKFHTVFISTVITYVDKAVASF